MKKDSIGIEGKFSVQVLDHNGAVCFDSGERKNLILDSFLDLRSPLPTSSAYLCIGAGVVTAPSYSDTNLGNQIASENIVFSGISSEVDTDGILSKFSGVADFTGLNGEEVSELGIRNSSSSGVLITRSLIKDSSGDATTITVNSGQTLRITYSIYVYFPILIGSGVISTPHGDLGWSYLIDSPSSSFHNKITNSDRFGGSRSSSVASNNYAYFERNNEPEVKSAGYMSQSITGSSASMSASLSSVDYDRVFTNCHNRLACEYGIKFDPMYTLPANYNFTISWEVTWGRLA